MRWMGQVRGGVARAWQTGLVQRATTRGLWKTAGRLREDGPRPGLLLRFHAENDPHRIALSQGDRILSFFELFEEVEKLGLERIRSDPSGLDRPASTVEHCPEAVVELLARVAAAPWPAVLEPLAAASSLVRPGDRVHVAGAALGHRASRGLAVAFLLLGKTVVLSQPDATAVLASLETRRATTAFVDRSVLDEMARRVEGAAPRPDLSSMSALLTDGPYRAELARAVFGDRVIELSDGMLRSVERLAQLEGASKGDR